MTQRPRLRAVGTPSTCPICDKPSDPKHRPFCSARCARVDLGRWLNETYRVPAESLSDDEPDQPRRGDGDDDS